MQQPGVGWRTTPAGQRPSQVISSGVDLAERHREIVLGHFEAKLACDRERLAADLADDVAWWAPVSTSRLGLPRPLLGRDAVVDLLVSVPLYEPGSRRWDIHQVIADASTAAVHATLTARTRSGADYQNSYVFVFEFAEGKIAAVWEHLDTAYAYERFASSGE